MEDTPDQNRIEWTTRINVRPQARDTIRLIARRDRISVATMIGMAIEALVTARSTA